jgi:hypothetical protein
MKFLLILSCCGVALAQNPELGRVERNAQRGDIDRRETASS